MVNATGYQGGWLGRVTATALLVGVAWGGTARADAFSIRYEAAGVQSANVPNLCASIGVGSCVIGTETFTTRASGAGFTTDFGTGGVIQGTYSAVRVNAADQYGGAGGVGTYAVAFGGDPYSVSLTTSIPTGINYFGFWLSALDTGNQVGFYRGGALVYSFTPADLIAALGACTGNNPYCGNPNASFAQQNNELYAFVNFYDTSGTFDQIRFSEQPANGGYESDNHTVGFVTSQSGIGVVPEPGTAAIVMSSLLGIGLMRRRRI